MRFFVYFLVCAALVTAPLSAQTAGPAAITTTSAPAAIGPYSQAVTVGNLVFLSAQSGLDPATSPPSLIAGGVEPEARQVMTNLGAVLSAAGLSFANVVKTTIYLTDIADFAKVNAIYGASFASGVKPARATVGVAALPRGAHIAIEAIAVRP